MFEYNIIVKIYILIISKIIIFEKFSVYKVYLLKLITPFKIHKIKT